VKRGRALFAIGLIIGLLAGAVLAGGNRINVRAQDDDDSGAMTPVEVVQQVGSAVVTVINEQAFSAGENAQVQPVGSGTGFIIDEDGHIVTNMHVVEGGEQFEVIFADGETYPAELVGTDPLSDLAVVQVDAEVPGTVPLGDSDLLLPGQSVLAIGSPLGSFTNTVTMGIVSATNRDFPEAGVTYRNLIQHDAAINPGNSGGPLFNLAGEVIGVNTLGIPVDESGDLVQGLFFAIPSNTVSIIAQRIIDTGEAVYPFFGISYDVVTPEFAAQQGLDVEYGVYVNDVTEGGPAEAAGVQEGDVVLSIDGRDITAADSFSDVLFLHDPGETVTTEIARNGETLSVDVTLGDRPEDLDQGNPAP
jgi:2-alkenal reductase